MMVLASEGFLWASAISDFVTHKNVHLVHAVLLFIVILVLAILYRKFLGPLDKEVVPSERVGVKNIFQVAVESLLNMVRSIVPHHAEDYLPLIGTIFIYLFLSNIMGLIPGFVSPSGNFSGNLAIGVMVFLYYNYIGIRRAGFIKYMGHFLGPSLGSSLGLVLMRVLFIAPLMFGLEIFSHCVRPVTLALRLFVNINGDHLVMGAFSTLAPIVVPVIFLAFGIFVALVQAFVFSLLSVVYIGLAVETQDH